MVNGNVTIMSSLLPFCYVVALRDYASCYRANYAIRGDNAKGRQINKYENNKTVVYRRGNGHAGHTAGTVTIIHTYLIFDLYYH